MKTISTLAALGLLIFACKICSTTGDRNEPPIPSSTPVPLMYARDFIKPQLGSFSLVKGATKEEARKTASGFALKLIDRSNDAGAGEYKAGSRSAAFLVCSYSDKVTPESLVLEMERDMRRATAWRTVTNVPKQNGKRVDAVDKQGNGLVIWNNGFWLFMTIGSSLEDASSLANSVGY